MRDTEARPARKATIQAPDNTTTTWYSVHIYENGELVKTVGSLYTRNEAQRIAKGLGAEVVETV